MPERPATDDMLYTRNQDCLFAQPFMLFATVSFEFCLLSAMQTAQKLRGKFSKN